MSLIDLSNPTKTFDVTTSVKRGGVNYMGPTVRINANSASDAATRAQAAGHTPNTYFPPEEVKSR